LKVGNDESWRVLIRRKVLKRLILMPMLEQKAFSRLVDDLAEKGPVRAEWPNFSQLSKSEYHCHLSYSWVACWRFRKQTVEIEVYYAGSREKAPY
jgi:hypothetical protein